MTLKSTYFLHPVSKLAREYYFLCALNLSYLYVVIQKWARNMNRVILSEQNNCNCDCTSIYEYVSSFCIKKQKRNRLAAAIWIIQRITLYI